MKTFTFLGFVTSVDRFKNPEDDCYGYSISFYYASGISTFSEYTAIIEKHSPLSQICGFEWIGKCIAFEAHMNDDHEIVLDKALIQNYIGKNMLN